MFYFAIVDDDTNFSKKLKSTIVNLKLRVLYQLDMYSNAKDYIASGKEYDLLILDIEMPKMSGISLSNYIKDSKTIIIFMTNYESYMGDAFGINIFKYILKKDFQTEFPVIFSQAISYLQRKTDLFIKTDWGREYLQQKNIILISMINRKLKIFTVTEDYTISGKTLSELTIDLCDDFIFVNRSTIINKEYMKGIRNDYLFMFHFKEPIEISRRRRKQIHEALYSRLDKL